MRQHEYEVESEWEGEGEYEYESEGEYEGEMEAEEFFGRIAQMARRAAQNPALRRIGLQAARGALSGLRGTGPTGAAASRVLGSFLPQDRKSTRLNSSHANISYAVFCLKKTAIAAGAVSAAMLIRRGKASDLPLLALPLWLMSSVCTMVCRRSTRNRRGFRSLRATQLCI